MFRAFFVGETQMKKKDLSSQEAYNEVEKIRGRSPGKCYNVISSSTTPVTDESPLGPGLLQTWIYPAPALTDSSPRHAVLSASEILPTVLCNVRAWHELRVPGRRHEI
jgi:hypothetical protein